MGYYTAIATRIKVRKFAPKEVYQFLDRVFELEEGESVYPMTDAQSAFVQDAIPLLQRLTSCIEDVIFKTYKWRVKEDCGDYWLYQSRAATKHPNMQLFASLMFGIEQYLVLTEGDILMREAGEDSWWESVLVYDGKQFVERRGMRYDGDHGFVSDSRHPKHHEYSREQKEKLATGELTPFQCYQQDPDFEPPWTLPEVEALVAAEKKDRDANWHPWG
jgi:hypothetical protein